MKHIKKIVLKFLLDLFIKLYAWVFELHMSMDIVLCLLPTEVKRGHWIPLSCSYECLPTTMSCWESNQGYVQECMLLTTQSSFSHLKIFGRDRLAIFIIFIYPCTNAYLLLLCTILSKWYKKGMCKKENNCNFLILVKLNEK